MPRYYFDLGDGDAQSHDDEGLILPNLSAAREEALRVLPDIAREVLPKVDQRAFVACVRNEGGQVVFRAMLTLVEDAIEQR